jgi:(p)ppGpp synthase/HD superfamily hydrolase
VLQIFSPLGHALGLSVASARLEDLSLEILFGDAYLSMRAWMNSEQERWLAVLTCMKAQAQEALNADEELRKLGIRAHVSTRAKSSYSLMKKLLTLSGALLLVPLFLLHALACVYFWRLLAFATCTDFRTVACEFRTVR